MSAMKSTVTLRRAAIRVVYPAAFLLFAQPAVAEVTSVDAGGFTVSHSVTVPAQPDAVWRNIVNDVSEWWNGDHSWSADAANLYIKPELGGCFCERLPGGGAVEHLRVIHVAPGKMIKFDGALGPLQDMAVQGRMVWEVQPDDDGSTVVFRYLVYGHYADGFDGISGAVDFVIGEQLQRLARRFE
jgi:uncharacterized protein YndB with AHSA1/START domain